ncbi:MAG TPA: hypothetical protein VLW84_13625 [Terriglobales bacterium]|nr:hypothetical protein [Terriglobales bacterium]
MRAYFSKALVLLYVTVASVAAAAQSGKVETIGPATDSSLSDSVKRALEGKGYRIILDDGSVAGEIWLRKSVAAGATKKDESNALYSQLAESVFFGVIWFPQATTDYRGEPIKAGAYTLRYELLPNDANHMGVAPNRDFLLLVPAAADSDPDAVFNFHDLVALSATATGTAHPAPISLVQAQGGATPSLSKDSEDHWIFSGTTKLSSGGDLVFGLVVKGTAPQ